MAAGQVKVLTALITRLATASAWSCADRRAAAGSPPASSIDAVQARIGNASTSNWWTGGSCRANRSPLIEARSCALSGLRQVRDVVGLEMLHGKMQAALVDYPRHSHGIYR
jgi:hypothetical protein